MASEGQGAPVTAAWARTRKTPWMSSVRRFGHVQRLLPGVAAGGLVVGGDAGDGELALEGGQSRGLAGDAADAAADEEILIEHGDGAEGGVGIVEQLGHDGVDLAVALGLVDFGEEAFAGAGFRLGAGARQLGQEIGGGHRRRRRRAADDGARPHRGRG